MRTGHPYVFSLCLGVLCISHDILQQSLWKFERCVGAVCVTAI